VLIKTARIDYSILCYRQVSLPALNYVDQFVNFYLVLFSIQRAYKSSKIDMNLYCRC